MLRFITPLAVLLAAPASAQSVAGTATAIDGDSLSVAGVMVRLHGIDAPEAKQTCSRDGEPWACGEASARQLAALVAGAQVQCRSRGTDAYGRTLAVCSANGLELNRTLVAAGWATAFREYSEDYVADEMRAKAAHAGIWSSTFDLPQDYRQARAPRPPLEPSPAIRTARAPSRAASVAGPIGRCAIKGNRNRKGQWIYHLPGMPYYEATRAEEFFCTEPQAQAAGYRRAIVR